MAKADIRASSSQNQNPLSIYKFAAAEFVRPRGFHGMLPKARMASFHRTNSWVDVYDIAEAYAAALQKPEAS
jgi:hypothetical protein